jgi:hypothetical protein
MEPYTIKRMEGANEYLIKSIQQHLNMSQQKRRPRAGSKPTFWRRLIGNSEAEDLKIDNKVCVQ